MTWRIINYLTKFIVSILYFRLYVCIYRYRCHRTGMTTNTVLHPINLKIIISSYLTSPSLFILFYLFFLKKYICKKLSWWWFGIGSIGMLYIFVFMYLYLKFCILCYTPRVRVQITKFNLNRILRYMFVYIRTSIYSHICIWV